jgi:hypothetical protein
MTRAHRRADVVDGAARIVHPIVDGFNTGTHIWSDSCLEAHQRSEAIPALTAPAHPPAQGCPAIVPNPPGEKPNPRTAAVILRSAPAARLAGPTMRVVEQSSCNRPRRRTMRRALPWTAICHAHLILRCRGDVPVHGA